MICEYGCGKFALFQFKNGKWCCSENTSSCKGVRKKRSRSLKGRYFSEELKKLLSKNHANVLGSNNPRFLSISKIKRRHPFFSKIEEMRYNPNKPGEKEIQVHCKNHNCPNSKEQGGWFTPTKIQFKNRKDHLENEGEDKSYFYCSEKCRDSCYLYNFKGADPFQDIEKSYTESEYQTFRKFVLERDNYNCQYCDEPATDVHHERPQKLEPFFSLDPDLAWACCEKCHYEKGHKDECSTYSIRNKC